MDATDLTALTAAEIVARVHDGRASAVARREGAPRADRRARRAISAPSRSTTPSGCSPRRARSTGAPTGSRCPSRASRWRSRTASTSRATATRHGSAATSTEPARRDDELVKRLRAAGAVVLGKTRMPELAIWGFTHSALGTTRNPLDPRAGPRRLQRGQRRGRGGGAGRARAGHRRRRLDPHPGGVLRAGRRQAGPRRRPAAGRGRRALVRYDGGGPAGAHRRGRRADAGRARRAAVLRRRAGPRARGAVPVRPAAVHVAASRSPRRRSGRRRPAARRAWRGRGHARRPALPAHARPGVDPALAGGGGQGRGGPRPRPHRRRAPHGRGDPARASGAAVRATPRAPR